MKLKKTKSTSNKKSIRVKKSDLLKEADQLLKTKKKKKKMYFGKEAHAAIVEYQSTDVREEKHRIYEQKIKNSFEKLAENLIFIHNFSQGKDHFHILKSDTVSFLYEILEKFDPEKGSKAFSYFNVCAKNFLIIQSKKRLKNKMRHISIDDESLSLNQKYQIERYQIEPSPEDNMMMAESSKLQKELILRIKDKLTNKNEIACIDATLTLFENVDSLDFLNKRALFVYLREISGLNAKQLSVAMSNIRKHYREISKNNLELDIFHKFH